MHWSLLHLARASIPVSSVSDQPGRNLYSSRAKIWRVNNPLMCLSPILHWDLHPISVKTRSRSLGFGRSRGKMPGVGVGTALPRHRTPGFHIHLRHKWRICDKHFKSLVKEGPPSVIGSSVGQRGPFVYQREPSVGEMGRPSVKRSSLGQRALRRSTEAFHRSGWALNRYVKSSIE